MKESFKIRRNADRASDIDVIEESENFFISAERKAYRKEYWKRIPVPLRVVDVTGECVLDKDGDIEHDGVWRVTLSGYSNSVDYHFAFEDVFDIPDASNCGLSVATANGRYTDVSDRDLREACKRMGWMVKRVALKKTIKS